jgi:hypothetical protein
MTGPLRSRRSGNRPGLGELRRRNGLLEWGNEVLRRAAVYLPQSNVPSRSLDGVRAMPAVMRGSVAWLRTTEVKWCLTPVVLANSLHS